MVDDQRKIRKLTGKSYTPSECINLAYLVIASLPIFYIHVRRYCHYLMVDQIYSDIIMLFQDVHTQIREIEAPVEKLRFPSDNAIITQIVNQLRL